MASQLPREPTVQNSNDSKQQLQTELDDSGFSGSGDAAEVAVPQQFVRRIEVGVVQGVEELRPELQVSLLGEVEVLA